MASASIEPNDSVPHTEPGKMASTSIDPNDSVSHSASMKVEQAINMSTSNAAVTAARMNNLNEASANLEEAANPSGGLDGGMLVEDSRAAN